MIKEVRRRMVGAEAAAASGRLAAHKPPIRRATGSGFVLAL